MSIMPIEKSPLLGRGLKCHRWYESLFPAQKSPLLGRGLKYCILPDCVVYGVEVAPVGAWIEIHTLYQPFREISRSRPCWGVD